MSNRPSKAISSAAIPKGLLPQDVQSARLNAAKSVNELLNYYVAVTDSKASIFLAGSVTAAAFLLFRFPPELGGQLVYLVAAVLLGACMVCAALTIIPRLPVTNVKGKGGVFWGDIASHKDAASYGQDFAERITRGELDQDYLVLNFKTSQILKQKTRMLRFTVVCFAFGIVFALIHHLGGGTAG